MQKTFVGKYMKKQPLNTIKSYMTDIDVKGPSCNEMARFAKEFCCSVVHTGCIKMNSNIASIEHYETAISGMQMYFKHAKDLLSQSCPQAKLMPPI